MATVYPRERIVFDSEPYFGFAEDRCALSFAVDPAILLFNAEPEISFCFEPFESGFIPVDAYRFLTADGEVMTAGGESLTW